MGLPLLVTLASKPQWLILQRHFFCRECTVTLRSSSKNAYPVNKINPLTQNHSNYSNTIYPIYIPTTCIGHQKTYHRYPTLNHTCTKLWFMHIGEIQTLTQIDLVPQLIQFPLMSCFQYQLYPNYHPSIRICNTFHLLSCAQLNFPISQWSHIIVQPHNH